MASPEFHALLASMRATPRPEDPTMQEQREGHEKLALSFPPPETVSVKKDVAGALPVEWLTPKDVSSDAVILYFHGGGYCLGSLDTHRGLTARLAEAAKTQALSVGYRLAPEDPFPAAVDDAVAAYRWLRGKIGPKRKIIVSGDSAGGGLSVAMMIALRDAGDSGPDAAVLMSPSTDLAREGESVRTRADVDPMITLKSTQRFAEQYLAGANPKTPLASPIYADLKGLAPMYILVGDWEMLLDDSTRLAERARAAGVDAKIEVWPEMIHIWPYFSPLIPEGREALARMGAYIQAHTRA